jgi:hypothetical protein
MTPQPPDALRALIEAAKEAAGQLSIVSSDPYEDSSDLELAATICSAIAAIPADHVLLPRELVEEAVRVLHWKFAKSLAIELQDAIDGKGAG